MRFLRNILIYLIVIVIISLFVIKTKVQSLSKELAIVESEIIKERDNIHILKAEFVHLSKPQTIEKLAAKYLDLQVMNNDQLVSIEISNGAKPRVLEKGRLVQDVLG